MDSVGILEMGGASTQIAFVPDTSVLADKFPVTLGGVRYPLYVHRYATTKVHHLGLFVFSQPSLSVSSALA